MRHAVAGFAAGLAIASGAFAPAHSQTEDAVIVTAPRFPEDVRRLPASVTVLTAEDIESSAARTLPELLATQAGVGMIDFFGNNAASTSVDLRGYGITSPQNTLILLDGRRLNDFDLSGVQWSAIPLAAIERIEILRGTGAVLYGSGASAGVINIVSRSPLKRGAAIEAFGRVASFDTREGQLLGRTSGPNFGLFASVHGYSSDGYRANNRNEQANHGVNLRWDLGASVLDLRFGTDRQDLRLPGGRRIEASMGLNEYVTDRRGARTPADYASRDGRRAGATLRHPIGDAELQIDLDRREKDQRTFALLGAFNTSRADELELDSISPRLRIPFALGETRHRLTLGIDRHAWRYRSRRTDLPQNLDQPVNRVSVDQDIEAFYALDTVELSRSTLLTLGWRDERARYTASDVLDPSAPGFVFGSAAPAARETQKEHAWELGLRHVLDASWTVFVRSGRNFRFVNAEEIYEFDTLGNQQFQLLRPQHALTKEAGALWNRGAHALRATLFRSDVRDEIHLDPFTTGVGNRNLPPSRREGVELDARWQATRALRLNAVYAYTDARFRDGVLPGAAFAIGTNLEIAGRRVPLVPEHRLNLGATWDLSGRTRIAVTLAAAGSQIVDNDEPNTLGAKIPSYAVVDLKLSRVFGWGRLALSVNNAFDEQFYTYAVRSAFTVDRYDVYPLPGRSVGVTAELKFE